MIKVIILDLDDTLLDTKVLEPLRQTGKWREVRNHLRHCKVHEDVLGLLNNARSADIKIAIFTNAPFNYTQILLKHFGISVDFIVAYHDVKNHKPCGEGVLTVLNHFGVSQNEAVYLGDSDLDRDAAVDAGVQFFGVEWGSVNDIDQNNFGLARLSEHIGSRLSSQSTSIMSSELKSDGNKFYLGYYLEGIKQEVWLFKDGVETAVSRWSRKTQEIADFLPNIDIVVRALGHAELSAENTQKPLDKIGKLLAHALGGKYLPCILHKSKALRKSTNCSAEERNTQVKGVYSVNVTSGAIIPEQPRFLIVDDVYTSGATAMEIQRAIRQIYPESQVYIFTLLKTLFRVEANKDSAEQQHNNQLLADLYSGRNEDSYAVVEPRQIIRKLVSKKFSANYTNTNHNFVFL